MQIIYHYPMPGFEYKKAFIYKGPGVKKARQSRIAGVILCIKVSTCRKSDTEEWYEKGP